MPLMLPMRSLIFSRFGAVPLSADAVLMFDGVSDQSNFPLGHLYAAENPGQLYDLYVSCAADKAKGILRIDQLVVIPLPLPGKSSRANAACPVHRIPAEHLKKILLAQAGRLFRTPAVLARICNEDFASVLTAPQTEQALNSIHTVWSQMFPLEQHKLIHTLISKAVVFEDKIQINFEAAGLAGC